MMIQLSSEESVSADMIAQIKVASSGNGVTVILEDGSSFWVYRDHGKSAYDTKKRLEAQIEKALGNVLFTDATEAERPMSRRDRFAAAALPQVLSQFGFMSNSNVAEQAFKIADAMIKESEK